MYELLKDRGIATLFIVLIALLIFGGFILSFFTIGGLIGGNKDVQEFAHNYVDNKKQAQLEAFNSLPEEEREKYRNLVKDSFTQGLIKSIEETGTHIALPLPVFYNGPVTEISLYECLKDSPDDLYDRLDSYAQKVNDYYNQEKSFESKHPECYDPNHVDFDKRYKDNRCTAIRKEIAPISEEMYKYANLGKDLVKKYCGSTYPKHVIDNYGVQPDSVFSDL